MTGLAGNSPRKGSGVAWAVAMTIIGVICLVVPVLAIRSVMLRTREAGNSVISAARSFAEAFRTGRVETTLRGYATEVKGMSKLQFAELRQLESFERRDSASVAWGSIPLPDVVVEARGSVVYTYVLDLQKKWEITLKDGIVTVLAPAPEIATPALDPSSLAFEVKKGSVLRDEAAVRDSLQAGLSELLRRRAQDHLPLVRETGRKATADFVRNFLVSHYDDAKNLDVRVRFADEEEVSPSPAPLRVEEPRKD